MVAICASALVLFATLLVTNSLPTPEESLSAAKHNCYADVVLQANTARRLRKRQVESKGDAFSYEGATGPAYWADLDPKNELCRSGKLQSPINFLQDEFLVKDHTPFTLEWTDTILEAEFENEGVTGKVKFETESHVVFEGTEYFLKQFHFHTPSEHHVDGNALDAEVHFVHISESGKILVLGALIEAGESANDQLLRQLIPRLPIGPAGTKTELHRLNLRSIINFFANSPWNTYEGSLTTPPCTEGVRFFIAANYLRVGEAQLRELKKVVKFSARYTQPYNGRGEE